MTDALTVFAFARLAIIVSLLAAVVPLFLVIVHSRPASWRDNLMQRWAARGRLADLLAAFQRTQALGPTRAPTIALARGAGGIIAFNGEQIAIDRFGSVSFMMHGLAGPRLLKASDLEAVRLQAAKRGARGHLQLVVRGVNSASPAADEHTVIFNPEQQSEFQHIAREIRLAIKHQQLTAARPVKALEAPRSLAPESASKLSLRRRRSIASSAPEFSPTPALADTVVFKLPPLSPEQTIPDERKSTSENRAYFIARWAYRKPAPAAQQNLPQSAAKHGD